eukprot:862077-Alexandrium_andersonii.AAC.1
MKEQAIPLQLERFLLSPGSHLLAATPRTRSVQHGVCIVRNRAPRMLTADLGRLIMWASKSFIL